MGYNKFVELGRVVHINYGPDRGKLAVVLDIQNENRVLIDGPTLGVERQLIPLKRVALTKFRIPSVLRNARFGNLRRAIDTFQLKKKWEETSTAKKIAIKTRRANLNDFERFKSMVLRRQLSRGVRKQSNVLGKTGAKGGAQGGAQKAAPKKK